MFQLISTYDSDAIIKQLVDTYDWYILPVINPDGYVHTWTTVSGHLGIIYNIIL